MKKKILFVAAAGCFLLPLLMLAACSNVKIANVERIMARYSSIGSAESQIYPSSINATELDQIYQRWDVYVSKELKVKTIRFNMMIDGKKTFTPSDVIYISVDKINGDTVTSLISMQRETLSVRIAVTLDFDVPVGVTNRIASDTKSRDVLSITFRQGDRTNESIQFRVENFTLSV